MTPLLILKKFKYRLDCYWKQSFRLRSFVANLGFPVHVHKLDQRPLSFIGQPVRSGQWILDLSAGAGLIDKPSKPVRLVGYPFYNKKIGLDSFEIWAVVNQSTLSQSLSYLQDQQVRIIDALRQRKVTRHVSAPTLLLPHYISHFGHFVVEPLGQLIWWADLLAASPEFANVEIAVFAPSLPWQEFLSQLCPKSNLRFYDSAELYDSNFSFSQPWLAPRLGLWQSLAIARNRIMAHLASTSWRLQRSAKLTDDLDRCDEPFGLFLTSGLPWSRLENFEEVRSRLEELGFAIVNPLQLSVTELFLRLAKAPFLVSEHGSIYLNALLSRQAPTLLLASKKTYGVDPLLTFSRGAIFNEIARGNHREILCDPVDYDHYQHPYSQRIRVNLNELEAAMIDYFGADCFDSQPSMLPRPGASRLSHR